MDHSDSRMAGERPLDEELQKAIATSMAANPPATTVAFEFAQEPYAVTAARLLSNERDRLTEQVRLMDETTKEAYARIGEDEDLIADIAVEKEKALEAIAGLNRTIADMDSAARKPIDETRVRSEARRHRPKRAAQAATETP